MTNNTELSDGGKYWPIYVSLLAAGIILLGDALDFWFFAKLTARLGITLLLSALFLIIGKGRPIGIIATAIVWLGFLITIFR